MSTELATQQQSKGLGEVVVHTETGDVRLNPAIVRKYLVNGNGAVTDQEIMYFLALCKHQQLNPFLRDAYLIKYSNSLPAAIVVSKEAFMKRADKAPSFVGYEAGIVYQDNETKEIKYTDGFCPPNASVVGGWAAVHRDDRKFPIKVAVPFSEYVARKNDGSPNRMWSEKPATMIRKVALVQALREAFPRTYEGMYSEEEVSLGGDDLPRSPVDMEGVIDVGEEPKNGNGNAATTSVEEQDQEAQQGQMQRRSRRNTIEVDGKSINTCGITAEQVATIREHSRRDQESRTEVQKFITLKTGYNDLSYLREDEAAELISSFPKPAPVSTETPPQEKTEAQPQTADETPTDLVTCPLTGDRMSKSRHCMTSCKDREQGGFCPAVDAAQESLL